MHAPSVRAAAVLAGTATAMTAPQSLNINDAASIKNVASTVAYGTMSYYSGNATSTSDQIALFPQPYYWWESGAAWGAMLDYYHYTGDASYNEAITQALLSQVGPDFNMMPPEHLDSLGNDDQGFWTFTILEAAERNYPQPDESTPSWLQIAENSWEAIAGRWNTTHCGGGLEWQVFADNPNGMSYKNSVSNGAFFQISARLARATGKDKYVQWAEKVWDWSRDIGLVDDSYIVYDGADSSKDCKEINPVRFTYDQGIYMYGAAVLYNYTNGDSKWGERTTGLLDATKDYFGYQGATDIMYEPACEPSGTCTTDMLTHKGFLSRFMWASTQMMPSTYSKVYQLLSTTAKAAAKSCSGGDDGTSCGMKWYTGSFDGSVGLGQQMTALETIQGLLVGQSEAPYPAGQIEDVKTEQPGNGSGNGNGNGDGQQQPKPKPSTTSTTQAEAPTATTTHAEKPTATTTAGAGNGGEGGAPAPAPTSTTTAGRPSATGGEVPTATGGEAAPTAPAPTATGGGSSSPDDDDSGSDSPITSIVTSTITTCEKSTSFPVATQFPVIPSSSFISQPLPPPPAPSSTYPSGVAQPSGGNGPQQTGYPTGTPDSPLFGAGNSLGCDSKLVMMTVAGVMAMVIF